MPDVQVDVIYTMADVAAAQTEVDVLYVMADVAAAQVEVDVIYVMADVYADTSGGGSGSSTIPPIAMNYFGRRGILG